MKYSTEDRAATAGFTRLERCIAQALLPAHRYAASLAIDDLRVEMERLNAIAYGESARANELEAELAKLRTDLLLERGSYQQAVLAMQAHNRELNAAFESKLAKLCDELEPLLDLLAMCNRDGGHYAEKHGIKRAVRQAKLTVERLFARESAPPGEKGE